LARVGIRDYTRASVDLALYDLRSDCSRPQCATEPETEMDELGYQFFGGDVVDLAAYSDAFSLSFRECHPDEREICSTPVCPRMGTSNA
jgi:hypothetical protein